MLNEDQSSLTGVSQTSFATSTSSPDKLRIPKLPKKASDGPFECQFCYMIISAPNSRAWKRHVHADLQPYICLWKDCSTPHQQFQRRSHWLNHVLEYHWRSWHCSLGCSHEFSEREGIRSHILAAHSGVSSSTSLDTLCSLGERPRPFNQEVTCPLCHVKLQSITEYAKHVGKHLVDIALFALPSGKVDDGGINDKETPEINSNSNSDSDSTQNGDPDNRHNKPRITGKSARKIIPLHETLACPYLKKDPRRHSACCGFGFSKISYMKAHLYRKHAIPIYCQICKRSFENVQLRDDHSRDRNCELIENIHTPDGITPEQRDWLHQRGPRSFSNEQQWFRVFEFLFPRHPLPRSPYNDTEFSEDLLNFRNFISEPTGQDILLQGVLEDRPELETIFRPDVAQGLNGLYQRWAARKNDENRPTSPVKSPSQEPVTSSAQSTREEADPLSPSSNSVGPEIAAREASGGGTSAAVPDLQEVEEPQLDSLEALAFAEYELEERKVDEAGRMPPR